MNIREKIVKLFKSGAVRGDQVGVRELMAKMPGELRASVSKECRYMEALGLLSATRAVNWHHGKRFLFKPTALLMDSGTLPASAETVLRVLKSPLTNKDLRYAMASACGVKVSRKLIDSSIAVLLIEGTVVRAPGGSIKYPRYVQAGKGVTGSSLAAVAHAWARAPWVGAGARALGRSSSEWRTRPRPQPLSA